MHVETRQVPGHFAFQFVGIELVADQTGSVFAEIRSPDAGGY